MSRSRPPSSAGQNPAKGTAFAFEFVVLGLPDTGFHDGVCHVVQVMAVGSVTATGSLSGADGTGSDVVLRFSRKHGDFHLGFTRERQGACMLRGGCFSSIANRRQAGYCLSRKFPFSALSVAGLEKRPGTGSEAGLIVRPPPAPGWIVTILRTRRQKWQLLRPRPDDGGKRRSVIFASSS